MCSGGLAGVSDVFNLSSFMPALHRAWAVLICTHACQYSTCRTCYFAAGLHCMLCAGLSRLTRLELAATQDAALAGISAAPQLRALMLHFHGLRAYSPPPASLEGCSAAGLISLTALTALSQLHLDQVEGKGLDEEEWRQLLSALRHVREVSFTCRAGEAEAAAAAWRSLKTHKPAAVMFQSF